MGLTEIVIIVIGLVCVGASFFISEKIGGTKKAEEKAFQEFKEKFTNKLLEEENLELLFNRAESSFETKVENLVNEKIEDTSGTLSSLSNDKILEFEEYSKSILAKIDENHTEVVFLYDMLKEKEGALKDLGSKIDGKSKELLETIEKAKVAEKEARDNFGELVSVDEKEVVVPKKIVKKTVTAKTADKSTVKKPDTVVRKKIISTDTSSVNFAGNAASKNDKILQLYNEGKSIVEISKTLGLGQGEVKLVIELFKNAK